MKYYRNGFSAVLGSSVAIFWFGAFIFGFPGVMAPYWQEAFGVGRGAIGSIMFFVLASVGTCMFFVGRWLERMGIRRAMTLGAILCGLDILALPFATSLAMVYIWAFLMGASSCLTYLAGLTTVQKWFPGRRGLVTGVVNFSFGVSGAIAAPMFGFLLDSMGYGAMTLLLGLVALVAGVAAAQLTAPPDESTAGIAHQSTQDDGDESTRVHIDLGRSLTVREAVKTVAFWCLWLTWTLQGAASISMVTLSTQYGIAKGFGFESAVMILTAFNVTNGFSRLLMGWLSDVTGRNWSMSLTFLASAAAYFALPYCDGLAAIGLLAAVIGFAFGTMFAVSAPLAVDCFGVANFGAIFGLVFTAYGFVAGPLGPALSGFALDATQGDFTITFSYLGAFSLVSAILIMFVTPAAAMRE